MQNFFGKRLAMKTPNYDLNCGCTFGIIFHNLQPAPVKRRQKLTCSVQAAFKGNCAPAIGFLLCSVGPNGICWAVDKKETVWRRLGAKVKYTVYLYTLLLVVRQLILLKNL
jgi:hypothetical protein